MTEAQIEQIRQLSKTENPFSRAVYESFLKDSIGTRERSQKQVLLDIIRCHCVLINQDLILKSPIIDSVRAHINIYNILFADKYKLVECIPTFFIKEEVDEGQNLLFTENICIGEDNLYYLCDCGLIPVDRGYDTMEELLKVHNLTV